MNDDFYKKLIEKSPIGYSYQRIICDEYGIPRDYEVIEVNETFEKFTGLKGLDIIGKRITEVLPHIRKSKFDWIHFCGDVAINGEEKEIEQFSQFLQRWYKVNIYSPKKDYFVTRFIDITKEKGQLCEMERLIDISEDFLQLNEQKIGYQKILDDFSRICGAKYAVFNLFDEDGKNFTTMAISGDKEILKKVYYMMGFRLDEKKWKYDKDRDKKIKPGTITRFRSLSQLVGDVIPLQLIQLLEKTYNIGEVILIKIFEKNIMLGDFTLVMDTGKKFDKDTLAEVYTRQLGMIIKRKRAEDDLLQEKIIMDAIFYSEQCFIYVYDEQGTLVRWNKTYQSTTGYSSEELSKMNLLDLYHGDDEKSQKSVIEAINGAIEHGFSDGEAELQKKDGTLLPMYFIVSAIHIGGKQYFAGVAFDIMERKKKEKEILYLNYHDQLTGLYNRRFYEEELKRLDTERNLPMTIVMGDVNGLKLINDSFGHAMGDNLLKKVAAVIKKECRPNDVVARLSGDEFMILLPKTDGFETEQIIKRITDMSLNEKVDSVHMSISFGYGTKNTKEESINEMFKKAEDNMYKEKLFESPSMRGKTINAIVNTLHEKNKREEQHSHRVSIICKCIGEALGLPEYEIQELKSVGLLHDIGKIAIDENILNKPGNLTDDEWKEIKRHPEIGYRILSTVNDMSQMAEYVLAHHERWDGKGYPKGLKGDEIPFVSRIIAIADSYDAMTSERSYRNALTKEVAMEELQKNSGTQFDPELVSVFIEKVLSKIS